MDSNIENCPDAVLISTQFIQVHLVPLTWQISDELRKDTWVLQTDPSLPWACIEEQFLFTLPIF